MKLTHTERQFTILFFVIVLFELITGNVPDLGFAHYIAKPAIVISLMVLLYNNFHQLSRGIRNLGILALAFSVLGDILLMFVQFSEHFFALGLLAFLVAHIFYVMLFLKHRNKKLSPILFSVILLIYALGIFYTLKDNLGSMLLPVILYIIIILTMVTTAYLRKYMVSKMSYWLVFLGAISFLISDSVLAINKFSTDVPFERFIVMITYALAQYLIVLGILKINVTNTKV